MNKHKAAGRKEDPKEKKPKKELPDKKDVPEEDEEKDTEKDDKEEGEGEKDEPPLKKKTGNCSNKECGHPAEKHYGGEKNWCNIHFCQCQELR